MEDVIFFLLEGCPKVWGKVNESLAAFVDQRVDGSSYLPGQHVLERGDRIGEYAEAF